MIIMIQWKWRKFKIEGWGIRALGGNWRFFSRPYRLNPNPTFNIKQHLEKACKTIGTRHLEDVQDVFQLQSHIESPLLDSSCWNWIAPGSLTLRFLQESR